RPQVAPLSDVVNFSAPRGNLWRPTQLTPSGADIIVQFCLMDMKTYQAEPWKYPLEPMLAKHSGCGSNTGSERRFYMSALRKYMSAHPSEFMEPTGFIFHETRCGSTLAANMMAHVPSNLVN
ncbi:unnamed protein product, partial [Phaeothamnion confervicola]